MLDPDVIVTEAESLRKQLGSLLGIELTPELAVQLYEAAMGVEGMELYRVVSFCAFESDRCRQSGAYFSACLMVASAIEGLLAILCLSSQSQVEETTVYKGIKEGAVASRRDNSLQRHQRRRELQRKILHATFDKFIQLADKLSWVPSDVIAPDLLAAAIQDFPTVSKNLFPQISDEARAAKLEAFKTEPGIEMLRFLQYLRNFDHPNRWPRLGVTPASGDLDQDCKFVYVIAYQVMNCLFTAFLRKSQSSISEVEALTGKSSPELRAVLSRFALNSWGESCCTN